MHANLRAAQKLPHPASPGGEEGKREGGGWDVGGGSDAGMDIPPAGTAAWVGKIRCALRPHPQPQLSCGFPRRVLGILCSLPPLAMPPPYPTLCSSTGREGRGEGMESSPWGQQAGDLTPLGQDSQPVFSSPWKAGLILLLLSFNKCLLSTCYVPTLC